MKFVLFLPHDVGEMRRQISSIGHRHFGVGDFGRRMFLTHVECWRNVGEKMFSVVSLKEECDDNQKMLHYLNEKESSSFSLYTPQILL